MRRLLGTLFPLGMLLVASCGSGSASPDTSPVPTSGVATTATVPDTTAPVPDTTTPVVDTTSPVAEQDAIAYFVRDERLVAVRRSIVAWDGVALLGAMLDGPTADEASAGVVTAVPDGSAVTAVTVDGSEATVDLNAAFASGGGSSSMLLRVAQVVFTVTQLPDVDTVRFRIDGAPVTSIGGEGVLVDGVGRGDFEAQLPEIFVESPLDGDPWVDPMVLSGSASTFEATVNFQVVAADGTVLQEGMTMATCGTGCVGHFVQELDPLPAGTAMPVTVRAFDISEADGSVIDLVEMRVG